MTPDRSEEIAAARGALPRTSGGNINNCALACGEPSSSCQMCDGACPDAVRLARGEAVEQRAGEEAFAAAAGERVEVTWGDELFQPGPLKFNPMRNGPFTASTIVRPGESVFQATVRLHREIAAAAQVIFEEKSAAYLKNLAQIASDASRVQIP